MIFKITTHKGHHQADVLDEVDQKILFDKLVGTYTDALPVEMKTKVPDTFQELEALWKPGKLAYIPTVKKENDEFLW